jgi:hypothetical protein
MTTGTIIMIICLVLLGLLEIFFKKDLDEMDKKYNIYDDPVTKGLDGVSGVVGMSTKDLDLKYNKK